METERIALRQRERERLGVLQEVKRKQLTQMEAARRLKLSDRHIRRLLFRLREHGDRAVIQGRRKQESSSRVSDDRRATGKPAPPTPTGIRSQDAAKGRARQ